MPNILNQKLQILTDDKTKLQTKLTNIYSL